MLVKVGEEIQQGDYVMYRLPLPVRTCNIIAYVVVSAARDSLSALIDLAFYTHVQ